MKKNNSEKSAKTFNQIVNSAVDQALVIYPDLDRGFWRPAFREYISKKMNKKKHAHIFETPIWPLILASKFAKKYGLKKQTP